MIAKRVMGRFLLSEAGVEMYSGMACRVDIQGLQSSIQCFSSRESFWSGAGLFF